MRALCVMTANVEWNQTPLTQPPILQIRKWRRKRPNHTKVTQMKEPEFKPPCA